MQRYPQWLKKTLPLNGGFARTTEILSDLGVNTVCRSGRCPNISDCFSKPFVTFLILGKRCTRRCAYCAVETGVPAPPDPGEPERIAAAVDALGLKYLLITSVTRDDLPDGGSSQFVRTVEAVRSVSPDIDIELLIPDFGHEEAPLLEVVRTSPRIIGHNIETVKRLYPNLRPGSDYEGSLSLLKSIRGMNADLFTKSGIMVGLGETDPEVLDAMKDLKETGCDMLTLGQYLAPDRVRNTAVRRFVSPVAFKMYEAAGKRLGFKCVSSGPFVRSSYLAEEMHDELKEACHGKSAVAAVG